MMPLAEDKPRPEPMQTLAREASFQGVGAHTGAEVRARLRPSGQGRIIFRRMDLGGREVSVDPARAEASRCTVLSEDGVKIRTVEHLLAALLMGGVDSVEVELDGEEIPILDGSAAPLVDIILEAGLQPLSEPRRSFQVKQSLRVEDGRSAVAFEPGSIFEVFYEIDYPHPLIGKQELAICLDSEAFRTQVAPARTFGFLKDAERLRAMGLARGSSLENTVVLDDRGLVNPPLRFPDEFVRHKILDLIGDLALLGAPLQGRVTASRAGHSLHLRAVQALRGGAGGVDFS
jgi:UDP-3-O-[3-hydroxymyristoyl] N-acetylglucosamine deacetylase